MKSIKLSLGMTVLFFATFLSAADTRSADGARGPFADVSSDANGVYWTLFESHDDLLLTVSGPDGWYYSQEFINGANPRMMFSDRSVAELCDGTFNYELIVIPFIDDRIYDALVQARATNNQAQVRSLLAQAGVPKDTIVQSGSFTYDRGNLTVAGQNNAGANDQDGDSRAQVFTTDLIVEGSACVGIDCTSSESFGFDTLRLKENNLRIHFDDTSGSANFPGNDWRLTANDSSNGGANYFSIDDATANNTPFKVEAGAGANALIIDDAGNIGVGTANPVVEVHIADGDSPTLRLEQNGSSGFQTQTWDLAGNETNFFVRDVTNGSLLPFRIKPSAPKNSIFIDSDGDVGLGNENPSAKLDVTGGAQINGDLLVTGAAASFDVTDTTGTAMARTMFQLSNQGSVVFRMSNTDSGGGAFTQTVTGSQFQISKTNTTGPEFVVTDSGEVFMGAGTSSLSLMNFRMAADGDVTIEGDLTVNGTIFGTVSSDVNMKENFEPVNPHEVLNKVVGLELSEWNYIEHEPDARHIGPMAQDFYEAFGLGRNEVSLSVVDINGVALASIQALNDLVVEKDAKIKELKTQMAEQLEAQEARLKALEALLLEKK